jgi:hypothetical protein
VKKFLITGAMAFCFAAPAFAEKVVNETPKARTLNAPIGGAVWEKAAFDGVSGVVIANAVFANWGTAEKVDLPAQSNLIIIREKRTKACRQQTVTRLGGVSVGGWNDCLIDTDDDGKFDRVSFNEVAGAKDINPPIPYIKKIVPIEGGKAQSFRQTLIYLGKSGGDIRLSYREFANDMARPAFSEDLTLPAPTTFPQTYQIKNLALTILAIGPDGLSYQVN